MTAKASRLCFVLPTKQSFIALPWGCGAAGSAPAWHAGGQGFESPQLHNEKPWETVAFLHLGILAVFR
jgi:hypothetical protein